MTLENALIRLFETLMLTTLVSGCLRGPVSESAVCAGTAQATTDHAAALVEDGGPRSVISGATLIRQLDTGCGR
jgi:hypothetical protein